MQIQVPEVDLCDYSSPSPLTKTAVKIRSQRVAATVSKGECLELCIYSYFQALLTGWPDFEKF